MNETADDQTAQGPVPGDPPLSPDPPPDPPVATQPLDKYEQMIAKTWRYLRIAMITLPVGIGAAVLWEYTKTRVRGGGHCLQGSISAYYYTPVNGMLVGALVAIGICLFALRGNTDKEDILLNLAGMFAPMIALVPTPSPGRCTSAPGRSSLVGLGEKNQQVIDARTVVVNNNMRALLLIVSIGLVVLLCQFIYGLVKIRTIRAAPNENWLIAAARFLGYLMLFVTWTAVTVLFFKQYNWFRDHMHYIAAGTMFGAIFIVVLINAVRSKKAAYRRTYGLIAAAMVGSAGFCFLHSDFDPPWPKLASWDQWLLWLEFSQIGLFSVFWLIQTIHGRQGLVEPSAPPASGGMA
jgi:hypothetical protein